MWISPVESEEVSQGNSLAKGSLERGYMNVAGKVHRAFAVYGIPAGRIGRTEILRLQANTS